MSSPIWSRLSLASLAAAYEDFLTGLEGVVARSAGQLQLAPGVAAQQAALAASDMGRRFLPMLQGEARQVLAAVAALGQADAGAPAPGFTTRDLGAVLDAASRYDAANAHQVARRQALLYVNARMRMPHQQALLAATGQLGTGVFAQLDRMGRKIGSASYVLGLVRHAAAETYAEAFVASALAQGADSALLVRADAEPVRLDLADLPGVLQHFHPNVQCWLQLKESA